jgi:hypothetical protein
VLFNERDLHVYFLTQKHLLLKRNYGTCARVHFTAAQSSISDRTASAIDFDCGNSASRYATCAAVSATVNVRAENFGRPIATIGVPIGFGFSTITVGAVCTFLALDLFMVDPLEKCRLKSGLEIVE